MLKRIDAGLAVIERDVRRGRLQRTMAIMTAFAAVLGGGEAYTQHSRGAFESWWMWTPVWLTGPMLFAAAAALASERLARTLLPITSAAVILDGVVGFLLHIRGITRMPGGFRAGSYNVVMGPPIFAPLLLCTTGVMGLLAGALRREKA
jgi:uncharacterized membrane protein YhaH (DUF805 family)